MSTLQAAGQWLERTTDYANAILVKETRQALKSRSFVVVFMLLLTASWAVSVFGLVMQGNSLEFGVAGRWFFLIFLVVLSAAVLFVVPFGAYRSLSAERDQNTYELLSITTLSPRQIIWGKLLSSLVQALLFYSAITPFIAFASLLQGFDVVSAAYLLVAALLVSLLYSTTALMLGSFARHRAAQAVTVLVVLGGLGLGLVLFLQLAFGVSFLITDRDFWWINVFLCAAGISYIVLFQQISIVQLTFDADNRSTRIRITCAAQFWLLWIGYIAFHLYQGIPWSIDTIEVFTVISILHWSAVGLFAATEGDYLSRRVRRQLPKSKFARLLIAPFMPGGARGYLYVLLHVAALWLISVALTFDSAVSFAAARSASSDIAGRSVPDLFARLFAFKSGSWLPTVRSTTALCGYLLIYVGIGSLIGRWIRSAVPEAKSAHLRVLALFIFGAGLIVPIIPRVVSDRYWRNFSFFDIPNPFSTYDEIQRSAIEYRTVIPVLLLTALMILLLHVRAMIRGVRDIVDDQTVAHVPSSSPAPAPAAAPVFPSSATEA